MVTLLFLSVSALTFVAAGYRAYRALRSPRDRSNPGRWALAGLLGALGFAFLFLAPAIQEIEGRLYPNLGRLLSNTATLTAALAALTLVLYLAYPQEQARTRVPRRLATYVVSVIAMWVLFFVSDIPESRGLFSEYYSTHPTLAGYVLVYSAYLGTVLVDLGRLTLRYSSATSGALRVGLRLLALGCLLGLSYIAEKLVSTLRQTLHGPDAAAEFCVHPFENFGCTMAVGMPAISVLVMLIGISLPVAAPVVVRVVRWPLEYRVHRELRPLWNALYSAVPEIALTSPQAVTGSYARRDVGMRLYRRVIEIRDGVLVVRPYRDPAVELWAADRASAAGLAGDELVATIEAVGLAAGIDALRRGSPATAAVDEEGDPADAYPGRLGRAEIEPELRSEAAFLRLVSRAFVSSPLIGEWRSVAADRENVAAGPAEEPNPDER
ncbi:MAB_1171c family putative transporter [Actinoalloteichus hymeniacidonis]|uniref:DUF6545 domain-containing protein n=1 Tax=Actinoalloteichus hymeniacidonis TaxID=340345 RepID=A0AAC9HPD3_9PSEU|nr:MAB_1171c family putative transporter [Actinoalloteichus hymeniacidonis]AOS62958.1 hypothetical protein TL08_10720 [Actinoalloteichus hymeniacidonis]MBB5909007.1 hypothetical protein [Actinoalloteichus hymeniacidonis]